MSVPAGRMPLRMTYLEAYGLEKKARRRGCDAWLDYITRLLLSILLTNNALPVLAYAHLYSNSTTYLPHAADDTTRYKHVLHDCWVSLRCGWGRGGRKRKIRRGHKVFGFRRH